MSFDCWMMTHIGCIRFRSDAVIFVSKVSCHRTVGLASSLPITPPWRIRKVILLQAVCRTATVYRVPQIDIIVEQPVLRRLSLSCLGFPPAYHTRNGFRQRSPLEAVLHCEYRIPTQRQEKGQHVDDFKCYPGDQARGDGGTLFGSGSRDTM